MILVIMGVSGSGKSTVGAKLAARLGATFVEGDAYHPPENIRKMSSGRPLDDADRWPWLHALRRAIDGWGTEGRDVVVTCSALKQRYRDVLSEGRSDITFVYLKGSEPVIAARIAERKRHFMPPQLLHSQFEALEEPRSAITVDVTKPPDDLVGEILASLRSG